MKVSWTMKYCIYNKMMLCQYIHPVYKKHTQVLIDDQAGKNKSVQWKKWKIHKDIDFFYIFEPESLPFSANSDYNNMNSRNIEKHPALLSFLKLYNIFQLLYKFLRILPLSCNEIVIFCIQPNPALHNSQLS